MAGCIARYRHKKRQPRTASTDGRGPLNMNAVIVPAALILLEYLKGRMKPAASTTTAAVPQAVPAMLNDQSAQAQTTQMGAPLVLSPVVYSAPAGGSVGGSSVSSSGGSTPASGTNAAPGGPTLTGASAPITTINASVASVPVYGGGNSLSALHISGRGAPQTLLKLK